jgi:hypothetical protein
MSACKYPDAPATRKQLAFIEELLTCGMFTAERQASIRAYQGLPKVNRDHARKLIGTLLNRKRTYDIQCAEERSWDAGPGWDFYAHDSEMQD